MGLFETVVVSVGLAMDAFAVAICKGLSMRKMNWKKAIKIGIYFGIFQMGMPIIGYILGIGFSNLVEKVDHWIAFILLSFIGLKMIIEAFSDEENLNDKVDFKNMFFLSIATSIDALAVGITFAFLNTKHVILDFGIIGIITFIISVIGVKIGHKFGDEYGKKAELLGGIILIFLGIKILIEHLSI